MLDRIGFLALFGALIGIFGPYRRASWRKHNPLQAMTYLALKLNLFTAGYSFTRHLKPMVTGFDDVELRTEEETDD